MMIQYKRWTTIVRYAVLIVVSIIILFPLYVLIATSFKTRVQTFTIPPKWFFVPTLQNYKAILFDDKFAMYLWNSVIVASSTAFFSVTIGDFAAYALTRFRFMGRRVISTMTLLMRMVPPAVLIVPLFLLWFKLGIGNSRTGLVFAYLGLNLSFSIWILRSFMAEIPVEIEESALIDGCSEMAILFRIVFPLIKPGIAVASIFVFRIAWNEFILALVLTNRMSRTLPVGLSLKMTDIGVKWGEMTAMATIIAIPAVIFAFFSARSIIRGLTAGAVKG